MTKEAHTVDAITSHNDITELRSLLEGRPLELLLFEMGIGSGLRIKDLLQLRVGDIASVEAPDVYPFMVVPQLKAALRKYLDAAQAGPEDFVFRKKRKNEPLSFSAITTMVKSWFEEAAIPGHYSSRSLHKTWLHNYEHQTKDGSNERDPLEQPSLHDLTPINFNSIEIQVQEELYKSIITGTLPAGTKLTASRLARQLEVNVVNVKIALAHLEEQGLVVAGKRKSFTVKALTSEDIIEICNIRLVLEKYSLERIRSVWSQETGELLEKILAKWELSRDVAECVHYHSLFHSMLYRDTQMPILLGYIKNLSSRMNALHIRNYATTTGELNEYGDMDINTHKLILKAVQSGNFEKAKKLLHTNIVESKKNCLVHIKMLQQKQNK